MASLLFNYDEVVRIFESAKVESFPYMVSQKYNPPYQRIYDLHVAEYRAPDNNKWVFASHYGVERVFDGERLVYGGHELFEASKDLSNVVPYVGFSNFNKLDPKFDVPFYFYWMEHGPNYQIINERKDWYRLYSKLFAFYLFKK